jgi:hypothetical protein
VNNTRRERAIMFDTILKFVPPLIRQSLLDEHSFRIKYGITTDTIVLFGKSGFTVKSSILFDAVRTVVSGDGSVELNDDENRIWNLTLAVTEKGLPELILSSDQQRLVIHDFSVLLRDASLRIRSLEEYASDLNMPLSSQEKWRSILQERALEDDEVDTFHSDIHDTPIHVGRVIHNQIRTGKSDVLSLVPNSRRYFERLVGAYDGSSSIRDYAVSKGREVFGQLTEWRPYEGFLFSLLLSSHSALAAEINTDLLNKAELEKAFDYLVRSGDPLSRLGAFEVGLRILPERPEVEPFLLRLLQRIRDDEPDGKASEFKLFSALFVLVDGELARTRLMVDKPPFYRRLASLAHASLIQRQLVQSGIDYEHFTEWALSNRIEQFYMQSFADMRSEPKWNPHFTAPIQLQADFIGRIIIAGNCYQANLSEGELRNIFLAKEAKSLVEQCGFLRPFLPGPLEGVEDGSTVLPDELSRIIEEHFYNDEVEAASFLVLVNSAMVCGVSADHIALAVNALRLANYRLSNLQNKNTLLAVLEGLATVAAIYRNQELADQLLILVRRYRHDSQYVLTVEEAFVVLIVAAAARKDLLGWRCFVGDFLNELAFSELEEKEGEILHSHLSVLLHCVPELWVSCAKADAALKAWCFR